MSDDETSESKAKRQRVVLTIDQKHEIIQLVTSGEKQVDVRKRMVALPTSPVAAYVDWSAVVRTDALSAIVACINFVASRSKATMKATDVR